MSFRYSISIHNNLALDIPEYGYLAILSTRMSMSSLALSWISSLKNPCSLRSVKNLFHGSVKCNTSGRRGINTAVVRSLLLQMRPHFTVSFQYLTQLQTRPHILLHSHFSIPRRTLRRRPSGVLRAPKCRSRPPQASTPNRLPPRLHWTTFSHRNQVYDADSSFIEPLPVSPLERTTCGTSWNSTGSSTAW